MFELTEVRELLAQQLHRVATDGAGHALDDWVGLVGECQAVANQVAALQILALARVASVEDVQLEDGTIVEQDRGLGHARLDAPALVSDLLGVSAAVATARVDTAVHLAARVPEVVTAMAQGRLDWYRGQVISDELKDAPSEACGAVMAHLGPCLGAEPAGPLRRRVRRALQAIDPDLLRSKAARARAERSLRRYASPEPGVDEWSARFPVEQSRTGWAVVDSLARQYLRDGKATTLENARADALLDLVHARATGTFTLQVALPATQLPTSELSSTAVDALPAAHATATTPPTTARTVAMSRRAMEDKHEAEALVLVSGLGAPGTTLVPRGWLAGLTQSAARSADADPARPSQSDAQATTSSEVPAGFRRPDQVTVEVVVCDDRTGALLGPAEEARPAGANQPRRPRRSLRRRLRRRRRRTDRHVRSYRPPGWLADLVKARDGHCRFPDCAVNARFCDVDHVIAWPLGATRYGNLISLCRRHHRIKQRPRWRTRLDPDGTVHWTDPTGRTRTTTPLDLLHLNTPTPLERRPSNPEGPFGFWPAPGTQLAWPPLTAASSSRAAALPSPLEDELDHHLDATHVADARRGPRRRADGEDWSPVDLTRRRDTTHTRPWTCEYTHPRARHRTGRTPPPARRPTNDDPPPF